MDAGPVLDRIAVLGSTRAFVLVGIGGHGGAGKSTLARSIPGLRGEPLEYRAFSWERQRRLPEPRAVRPEGVIVVEGVCALHKMFRGADVRRLVGLRPRPFDSCVRAVPNLRR